MTGMYERHALVNWMRSRHCTGKLQRAAPTAFIGHLAVPQADAHATKGVVMVAQCCSSGLALPTAATHG